MFLIVQEKSSSLDHKFGGGGGGGSCSGYVAQTWIPLSFEILIKSLAWYRLQFNPKIPLHLCFLCFLLWYPACFNEEQDVQ